MRIPFIQKKELEIISLLDKNTNWVARLNKVGIFLLFTLLVINISAFTWESNIVLLVPIISMLIGIGGYYIFKKIKFWLKDKFYYRDLLISFIFSNGLYKEGYSEYEERQSNGSYKTKKIKKFISSAEFTYKIFENRIIIYAVKNGDSYTSKMMNLDVELSALLGKPLYEKIEKPSFIAYVFLTVLPERKLVKTSSLPKQDEKLLIDVYADFCVNLKNNYSMLVSGASGAGKSYFTYFYLTRFISQKVNGKHAKLLAIDPKQSDLYKLFKKANMPTEIFGTSNSDAFRIVKNYLAEMERRMVLYEASSAFDSVGIDIGLEPLLLVIEEYSSLVASMDSKQKKEFESMVAIIAQKARSLSMGILIIMQQPRADSLSSNIREQLQNAVFLGNPSKEAAGMMFGTTDVPQVSGKGAGMYSIERNAPKPFESPRFMGDVFETILPVWQYVASSYSEPL